MTTIVVEDVTRSSLEAEPSVLPYTYGLQASAKDTSAAISMADDSVSSKHARMWYRLVLATIFWCFFTMGLNDGHIGPLLPIYQSFYHISYLQVSTIFISNCLGCITSALLNIAISRRLSFSKIITLGAILLIIGYSITTARPPFPVMCVGFFLNGMGESLINAQGNALLSMLGSPPAMGLAHASYGVGGFLAPILSTRFSHIPRWSLFYAVLLGTACLDLILSILVFRGKGYEQVLSGIGIPTQGGIELQQSGTRGVEEETAESSSPKFSAVLKLPQVHLLAAFTFIYVGVEVTIGGWIVTYIINRRGGGPSSGYISSGFFAGLALGRVLLLQVTRRIGEKNAVFVYLIISIGLEMVIWFAKSIVGDAVAVSLVGLVLGPFFPILLATHAPMVPHNLMSSSIGWITGFGQSGAAVLPFITGAFANRFGIMALQPLIVAMMSAMAVLWFILPVVSKKTE